MSGSNGASWGPALCVNHVSTALQWRRTWFYLTVFSDSPEWAFTWVGRMWAFQGSTGPVTAPHLSSVQGILPVNDFRWHLLDDVWFRFRASSAFVSVALTFARQVQLNKHGFFIAMALFAGMLLATKPSTPACRSETAAPVKTP